jgi:hypothetical protein
MLQENEKSWIHNLCALKELGGECEAWCFDVGVDTHRDGEEPMEAVGRLIKGVREHEEKEGHKNRVKFVLSKFMFSSTFEFTNTVLRELCCYVMWCS